MSEFLHVEKPFLDQLAMLGWTVIPNYRERKEWLKKNGAAMDL